MMSASAAPFQALSDDNHGPLVTLVSVALLITAIIFVAAKLGSVFYFKQRRTTVNTPIWIALILAIIQVVIMQKAVDHGLGQHMDTLEADAVSTASKFVYAAQLLQIITLSLSKLSTALLVWKLSPDRRIRLACAITMGCTAAWTIFGLFGIAFQCEMPNPWVYTPERCAGEGAILYPISVFHILTEVTLVILPFFMMRNVQMAGVKQIKILCSFSARLCVVGLAIAQLALLPTFLHSADTTWDIVNLAICGQAMMCVSVTIACLPTLYHIFAGLHSGLITTRLPDEVELSRPKGIAYINQSTLSASRPGEGDKEKSRHSTYGETTRFGAVGSVVTDITTSHYRRRDSTRRPSVSESTESTRHLTQETMQDGVLKTVDITVEVEEDRPHH